MDRTTLGVMIGSLSVVAGLSYWSKRSESAAEIEPLSSYDPEATFAGAREAVSPRAGSRYELMAGDGSPVSIGSGLQLSSGVLSVDRRSPSQIGRDVFLL